ncbi:sulfotransferase [Bizionia myxarmorum]|uniref:Sulfotransferase n=1 Tax=Bizionia myxarmorum TaxID=291186 RepID=A0A5D0R6D3_9FLAO|nr:sulfotransferase [Bizionia myxarmorum]TYB76993.1 sulfotransferase [Bizionia myxarmorum]
MAIKKIKNRIKVVKVLVENYFLKLFGYTYKGKRNQPIVFILSTGRCGSTSIKNVFNQHSKFIAFHEVIPDLIQLSTQLAENANREKEIYSKLDAIFSERIWEGKRGEIIVHSDHRLWNLVPYLSRYFKHAFFIHLIRNPSDSVKSYIQRDWHLPTSTETTINQFDKYRLYGDKVHAMPVEAWEHLNQTERCLWYWNYVNTAIAKDLNSLDINTWGVVKLETFIDDMNQVIKTKFQLEADFFFKDEITNRSKKEIKSDAILAGIEKTIQERNEDLFLNYYPNYKQ